MRSILCATKFVYLDKRLFFQNEIEGAIGYISVPSGDVHFFESIPGILLDVNTRRSIMCTNDNSIFIISNKGKNIYEISAEGIFTSKIFEYVKKENCEWAGIINYSNNIYAFGREKGFILRIDCRTKQVSYENTGITDKLMWVGKVKNIVYGISWDCKHIYKYCLDTKNVECSDIKICESIKFESNSFIPLHGMWVDDTVLYLHDKNIILKYDIISENVTVLYKNEAGNNGSRIIILDNSIIVPSADQRQFCFIDKQSGAIQEIRRLTADVELLSGWSGSGEPCYTQDNVYLPIINSNRLLCIKRDSMDFEWIRLKFDDSDIKSLMQHVMKTNIILQEGSVFSVNTFLHNL